MAASRAGLKYSTFTWSNAGTPPYGPVQGASRGFFMDVSAGLDCAKAAVARNAVAPRPRMTVLNMFEEAPVFRTGMVGRRTAAGDRHFDCIAGARSRGLPGSRTQHDGRRSPLLASAGSCCVCRAVVTAWAMAAAVPPHHRSPG